LFLFVKFYFFTWFFCVKNLSFNRTTLSNFSFSYTHMCFYMVQNALVSYSVARWWCCCLLLSFIKKVNGPKLVKMLLCSPKIFGGAYDPAHNFVIWSRILKLFHRNDHHIDMTQFLACVHSGSITRFDRLLFNRALTSPLFYGLQIHVSHDERITFRQTKRILVKFG